VKTRPAPGTDVALLSAARAVPKKSGLPDGLFHVLPVAAGGASLAAPPLVAALT